MSLRYTIDSLFRAEYRPLCLYAMHYVDSMDIAEDMVSSCFESLWERLSGDASVLNMRAYLYTSVRNASIDYLRRNNSAEPLPRDLDGARLWTAIDKMPARRKEVLLMAKRDGMSYAQIASALGISENTVRNTLEAALKSLRTKRKEILDFIVLF